MIIDIFNELLTDIKYELEDIPVLTSYPMSSSEFPIVIIEEIDNSTDTFTKDSSGFTHVRLGFSIEIFTKGNRKVSNAKEIRNKIDNILTTKYGLTRHSPVIIPNFADDSIFRYRLTYTGLINKDRKIFRG